MRHAGEISVTYRAPQGVRSSPHGHRVSKGGGDRNVRGRRIDYLALRGWEHVDVLDISLSDGVP